ncbi:DUF4087 domain-containing protein [Enterobacter bugandensis]|jgi:hypothetical protein|nr:MULTISPECIES: DUF4087 domain-containing protein [Enterobacter]MCK6762262.1 DUF4087 domain-containing protein [Enterobacter bugandensis]MCK6835060.1 DUF4087 domain-containing protein [Enterobacter bugandensis]MCK7331808.1 DUF4087 domain-containing protein [Enterobacter bugandensis]MCK7390548.1 DUF4087 domain-containing protein [Enterobacter bugandensis]
MRKYFPLVLLILSNRALASKLRCGWLQNPSPANQWLTDRDGTWDISLQGGNSSSGVENLKEFLTINMLELMEITDMEAPVSGVM